GDQVLSALGQLRRQLRQRGPGTGRDDELLRRVQRDAGQLPRGQTPRRLHRAQHAQFGGVSLNRQRLAGLGRGADGGDDVLLRHAAVCSGKTLLGLSSHSGSQSDLIRRCWSSSTGVNWTPIRSRFSTPTPCSPVRQPPTSTQSVRISAPKRSARSKEPGSLASNMMSGWRLPSPAWKMLATLSPYWSL